MSKRAQDLIQSFYDEEIARKASEITYSDFMVRLNSADIAMLEVIAKRFGKSADRIASEALSAALYSMVEALDSGERKQMAKEADELDETLSKKASKANGNPDFNEKSVTWVMNDRAMVREENRRKKEQQLQTEPDNAVTQGMSTELEQAHTDQAPETSQDNTMASVFNN